MSGTGLVIYGSRLSQPCRALILLVKALKLEYTETEKSSLKQEDYLKIHPFGTIPAVSDGDINIIESCSALRYIASKYDTSGIWYPTDLVARMRVDEFLDWHHTKLRKHGVGYFFNWFMSKRNNTEPDMPLINGHKEDLKKMDADMQKYFLNGRDFVAGNHVTIADLTATCELEQAIAGGVTFSTPIMNYIGQVKAVIGPEYDQVHEKLRTAAKPYLNK